MSEQNSDISRLIEDLQNGHTQAADELLPLVYAELRRLARARLAREKHGAEHQPTSLVHDAYIRLIGDHAMQWEGRAHFFGAAAEAMRRILIEQARQRARLRHGAGRKPVTLDDNAARIEAPDEQMIAIDTALEQLQKLDRSMSDVVKLRYFAGLTVEETAAALEISPRSVNRLWSAARAWLHRAIS
jgi:RNA polymerase sigma factor (TIGR02999 family)